MLSETVCVPAYIYPTLAGWTQYVHGATTVSRMIANVNSGPDVSQNSDYVTGITAARAAGIKVPGYVHTSFGARDINTVKAEIDSWYSFYTIDGIFLDEVQADSNNLTYYTNLYNYIKGKDATRNLVILNPGVLPAQTYPAIADTICLFENNYAGFQSGWSTVQAASWINGYSPSKWLAVVYNIPDVATLSTVIQSIKQMQIGFVFLTDVNGYTAAPSSQFWLHELLDAQNAAGGLLPNATIFECNTNGGFHPEVPGKSGAIRALLDGSGNVLATCATSQKLSYTGSGFTWNES